MAKRHGAIGLKNTQKRAKPHKTKKRLAAKARMLAGRASKKAR